MTKTPSPTVDDTVLDALFEVLRQRRHAAPEESYVASLHHKGLNKILEKIGEEAKNSDDLKNVLRTLETQIKNG